MDQVTTTPLEYAVPDLADSVQSKWRGFIDHWDVEAGVQGWALMLDLPLEPVTLEIMVGDTPFARTQTGLARSDIDWLLGVRVTPGFHFPPSLFARLARLKFRRRGLPVRLRFADTQVFLPATGPTPSVGEFVDAWRRVTLGVREERDSDITSGDRLLARLAAMRAAAESFRDLPLRPSSAQAAGHIEAFHVASGGQLWFIGWMLRDAATEFSALIVDRQKYAGGAATIHFERQDLASRYVGVVGVMDTHWTPPSAVTEFFIYCGPEAQWQVRAGANTTLIAPDALLSFYRLARSSCVAGNADALAFLLTAGSQWLPGNAAAAGIAADASIDRLLMIPGFGCIAEGWAISTVKTPRTFELKIGECLLLADETSIYFKSRLDLEGVFGAAASRVARGGFVTVFRGALPGTASGSPLLRVIYDDGTSTVHAVEAKLLQRLDCLSDSTPVLGLYPSLRHETFYPAMLAALQRQMTDAQRTPRVLVAAPCRRAIVIRVPAGAGNRRLCFDAIARFGFDTGSTVGICLLADNSEGLAEAKLLFHELKAAGSTPLSLFCLDVADEGFTALPMILAHLLVDRFVYVGRGVALTTRGWRQALTSLNLGGHAIHFFEFIDDTGAPDRIGGVLSAACFGWTTAALFAWLPGSSKFVRGVCSTSGLPAPTSRRQVLPTAAMRLETASPSRLADMIDEDVLALTTARVATHG